MPFPNTPWDWHIFTYIGVVLGVNVCKYASPMECLGFVCLGMTLGVWERRTAGPLGRDQSSRGAVEVTRRRFQLAKQHLVAYFPEAS